MTGDRENRWTLDELACGLEAGAGAARQLAAQADELAAAVPFAQADGVRERAVAFEDAAMVLLGIVAVVRKRRGA